MINNKDKVAVIFGVRNSSSIAWDVAVKLHLSGCNVALSYVAETRNEVLYLMEQQGMDSHFAAEVDVRDELQIKEFLQKAYNGLGAIDYVLHGVAFGNQQVMCYSLPGSKEPAPVYLDIPYAESHNHFSQKMLLY
jgi:enoyl-[acyl-carrier protein] reductase I